MQRIDQWFNRKLVKVALFGAAYLVVAILTSQISFTAGSFPSLWLPGGLLLGVLLLTHPGKWPIYLLASLPGNLFYALYFHQPFFMAGVFYLSNCLEASASAWLLLRLNNLFPDRTRSTGRAVQPVTRTPGDFWNRIAPPSLATPRDVLLLIAIAGPLGAVLSAGIQSAVVLGALPGQSYWPAFRSAWTGHILGVMAVTPVMLTWHKFRSPALKQISPERIIEMASLFIGLAAWAYYLFSGNALFIGRGYVVMPFLVWAALRFGPRGTSLCGLLVAIAAAWGLVWQLDSFAFTIATIAPNTDLLGVFLGINLVTSLFLTTSLEEGRMTAAELRKSQERYKRLIESQGEGIGIVDFHETFTFSNPAGNQIFGVSDTLVGRNLRDFTPPEQLHQIKLQTQRRRHREKTSYEIEIIRPDGQKRQLLLTATPEFDEQGRVNGSFTIFRDITDRKTYERALRESQERFQVLFDHSPIANFEEDFSGIKQYLDELRNQGVTDFRKHFEANPEAVWVCQRMVKVLNANQAAAQLCSECGASEFLTQGAGMLRHGPDDVMIEEIIAISEGKLVFDFEGPNDLVNNSIRYHHVSWSVAPGAQHDYSRVIVTIIDITERKRTEEKLRYLSTHDVLTGLYNRNFFEAEMERLQVGRQFPVNLMVVDVNGMKITNDTYGHAAGDDLLKRTAQVLQVAFRKEDIIARIGGDEFVVMFTGSLPEKEAVQRVRDCLEEHNLWSNGQPLSLAIGVASGPQGSHLLDVMKKADQQMYREKNRIKRAK